MIRVADYIFEKLASIGVKTPFVVTGRGALFLNDAIAKRIDMEPCFVHHEQSASFAAIAASEVTGVLGCAVVSTGCASTNTLTGVLSAWQDGIPAIFISGQNALSETTRFTQSGIRTYGQQEADIIEIVQSVTKYSVMVTEPDSIRYELEKALYLAEEGRKGPVWIDVPLDIQNMRVDPENMKGFEPSTPTELLPSMNEIHEVASDLSKAERPVILIGSGIKHSQMVDELQLFAERNQIPVVYTLSAADVLGTRQTLCIGSVGSMGCSRAGAFAVQNSDYLLVLGSRLTSMTVGVDYCKFARNAKVVVVDIDKQEHSKDSIKIDQFIHADLKLFFEAISDIEINTHTESWVEKCIHWKKTFKNTHKVSSDNERVDLYDLADQLSTLMPETAVFVCDSGFSDVILPTNIDFGEQQTCVHPVSQGAMGFAVPAAIGIYECSKRPTVVVVGDGSIMMNLQELQTISSKGSNIKIFVINNNAYAIIRRRQKELFRKRTIGTDSSNGVTCPNFKSVAECFNLKYHFIEKTLDLHHGIQSVLDMSGPVLCEIMGLEDQQYVEVSFAKTKSKKFVRRPLEDQWPFLDRDVFLQEMLIDPIDQ
jgi:acetolactate synthase I/II/III large subunit